MAALSTYEPTACFSELRESEFAESMAEQQEKAKANAMGEQRILVARALRGDKDAFDDIFDRYSGLMLHTAYGIVKDQDGSAQSSTTEMPALPRSTARLDDLSDCGVGGTPTGGALARYRTLLLEGSVVFFTCHKRRKYYPLW